MILSEQKLLCSAMLLFLQRQTLGVPGIPSGHLYAQLMSVMSLAEYNECLEHLKLIGAVVEAPSHLLTLVSR